MSPAAADRVDQFRSALLRAYTNPCTCGDCPTTAQLVLALLSDDEDLLALLERAT